MTHPTCFLAIAVLIHLGVSGPGPTQTPAGLPPVVLTELKHLEETYRVLDVAAEQVWPGWNDYRQVPFLFEYENGLKILIGHPNPPKGFEPAPGVHLEGRAVLVDRSSVIAKPLVAPQHAGGGPIPFGATADGRMVDVVRMIFHSAPQESQEAEAGEGGATPTEDQILIYIHELFHCFQKGRLRARMYGNLQYNADANYALYSEIEGLALHRAYLEPSLEKARESIKDFLVARDLKRAGSMTELQGNEESSDELNEGTATYAEVRTLEVLKAVSYTPRLTPQDDPEYHGFSQIATILRRYPDRLLHDASAFEDPRSKAYQYGCFQALLCQRLAPGWQQALLAGSLFVDHELGARVPVSAEERPAIERRLKEAYPYAEIRARTEKAVGARDAAYRQIKARVGRVYVVDLKATRQFVGVLVGREGSQLMGLTRLYPDGFGPVTFDQVQLSRVTVPAETDQLYYVRVVDTDWRSRREPYTVGGTKQADGTWKNAVVQTPLFTLRAPQIRIKETQGRSADGRQIVKRIRIQVLSSVP